MITMMNKWIGTGRITRDLEVKQTNSGISVLNFSIAVERPFKNSQGERETDFIDIVAFRNTAENIATYFDKGDGIGIEGRIQTGSYENNEGRTIYTTDIVADRFDFPIQNRNSNQGNQSNSQNNYNQQSNQPQRDKKQDDSNPFADVDFDDDDPFANSDEVTDISDDDLPFD